MNRFENKRHLNIYETTEDFSSLFQGGESKKREKKISYIVERKTWHWEICSIFYKRGLMLCEGWKISAAFNFLFGDKLRRKKKVEKSYRWISSFSRVHISQNRICFLSERRKKTKQKNRIKLHIYRNEKKMFHFVYKLICRENLMFWWKNKIK